MILPETILNKVSTTASRIIENEAVIIIPQENKVHVLNEVGSRIWDLIDGRRDIKQIAALISDEFSISYEEAVKDITSFIDELHRKNIVTLS